MARSIEAQLADLRARSLYRNLREIGTPQQSEIELAGRKLINFSSNDYLGLANDLRLREAAKKAGVTRRVSPHAAAKIIRELPRQIEKFGVFVNQGPNIILQTVLEAGLTGVQLHGDETPKYCEKIADYISVIKAFRLGENDNVEWMSRPYQDVCDMFMFDTEGAGYGGTGKKFKWELLKEQT